MPHPPTLAFFLQFIPPASNFQYVDLPAGLPCPPGSVPAAYPTWQSRKGWESIPTSRLMTDGGGAGHQCLREDTPRHTRTILASRVPQQAEGPAPHRRPSPQTHLRWPPCPSPSQFPIRVSWARLPNDRLSLYLSLSRVRF